MFDPPPPPPASPASEPEPTTEGKLGPVRPSPRVALFTLLAIFLAVLYVSQVVVPTRGRMATSSRQIQSLQGRTQLRMFYYLKARERLEAGATYADVQRANDFAAAARESYSKAVEARPPALNDLLTLATLNRYLGDTQGIEFAMRRAEVAYPDPKLRRDLFLLHKALLFTAAEPQWANDPGLVALLKSVDGGPLALSQICDRAGLLDKSRAIWRQTLADSRTLQRVVLVVAVVSVAALAIAAVALVLLLALPKFLFRRRAVEAGWGLGGAAETLLLWFLSQQVVGAALLWGIAHFGPMRSVSGQTGLLVSLLAYVAASVIAFAWFLRAVKGGALGSWFHLRPALIPVSVGAGCLAITVTLGLVLAATRGFHLEPPEHPEIAQFVAARSSLIRGLMVLLVCALGPIVEEMLFRGILFGGLRRYLPFGGAALLSALLFSLLHASSGPAILPAFAFFGFALAALYEYTGSLWPSILVHAAFNSFNILNLLILMHV